MVSSHYLLLLIRNILYNKLSYFYTIFCKFLNRNHKIQEVERVKTEAPVWMVMLWKLSVNFLLIFCCAHFDFLIFAFIFTDCRSTYIFPASSKIAIL